MSQTIKIATWNVNSIRIRMTHVIDWLRANQPDILCLQETKVPDEHFPAEPFEDLGYGVVTYGQKSYNGVAILSFSDPGHVQYGFPDDLPDAQRRFLAALIDGIHVVCVYVPNGESVTSPKFEYKMEFLARLERYLKQTCRPEESVLVCGDFNIAPADLDLHAPKANRETVMFHSREHTFLDRFRTWGLTDLVRHQHPEEPGLYSWWDYRSGGFPKNQGWRIDHIWGTAPLVQRCVSASIDRAERSKTQPSDHVPVVVEFRTSER